MYDQLSGSSTDRNTAGGHNSTDLASLHSSIPTQYVCLSLDHALIYTMKLLTSNDANPKKSSSTSFPSLDPSPPNMSSPAPLLRPPIPGGRQSSGTRTPRLGLAIPPSPNVRPLNSAVQLSGLPQPQSGRPSLPKLQLATPMGSTTTPYEQHGLQNGRPQPQPYTGQSASGGSESSAAHSRSGSFGPMDDRNSGPTSAGSQYSTLSFASQYAKGLGMPHGTPDPTSAVGSVYSERSDGGVGMEREGSMNGLLEGFDALSLERGRTLDVEQLDDDGWRIASLEQRIIELGSLGEGAGGAVTRCKLKGGKTIFALKVCPLIIRTR
jgi:mitogen-activated protein kinase kinase